MTHPKAASLIALIAIVYVTSTNAIAHEGHDHSSPDTPVAASGEPFVQGRVISEPPPFETLNATPIPDSNPIQRMPTRIDRRSYSDGPVSRPPPATLPNSQQSLPQPRYDRPTPNRMDPAFPQDGFAPRYQGSYGTPAFEQPNRGTGQHGNCGHDHGSPPARPTEDQYRRQQLSPEYSPGLTQNRSPYFFGEDDGRDFLASGSQCESGRCRQAESSCPYGNDSDGLARRYSPSRHYLTNDSRRDYTRQTFDVELLREPRLNYEPTQSRSYDLRTPYRDQLPYSNSLRSHR